MADVPQCTYFLYSVLVHIITFGRLLKQLIKKSTKQHAEKFYWNETNFKTKKNTFK